MVSIALEEHELELIKVKKKRRKGKNACSFVASDKELYDDGGAVQSSRLREREESY